MADSFSDLLQQILPVLQGVAQSQPQVAAAQAAAHVATPVVQPVLDLTSAIGQAGAGTTVGPLLAPDLPPAARSSPAGAAGFQAGRAIGALLSGAGPGGLAQVAQQGQAEWHGPEPFPGYKGVFEAPFNPLSYVGMPQGKAAGALADVGGPLGRAAGGLARGNEAWQGAVSNAIQRATDLIGTGVRKLPAAVGETSVRSAKTAEAAAAQDVAQRFGRLADQSIAPPEARNAVRYLAGEETARQFTAPPNAGDLLTAGRPSDFDAALGIDRTAGAPTRGALDQIQAEVIDQYTRRARHDIDIARSAYKTLGLPEDAPLSTVIAQADAAAPPILDAIPEARRLYQEAHPGQPVWNDADFNSLLQEAEHNVAAASPGIIDDNAAHWSTVLHVLQDTYGDLALNQRGAAAAAARRLTLERGAAPVHPAAESLGLTAGTPEASGVALGAAPPDAAAPVPPAGTAPAPPGAGPLTHTQWSSSRLGVEALYHETDPRTAALLATNPGNDLTGIYLSAQPELALGQAGKGAVIEFAPTPGLEVRPELGKPGAAFVAQQTGQAPEYTVLKNRASDTVVRSVTFTEPLPPQSVEARRLANLGWTPEPLPDGGVRYRPPAAPSDLSAPAAPGGVENASPFSVPPAGPPPLPGAPLGQVEGEARTALGEATRARVGVQGGWANVGDTVLFAAEPGQTPLPVRIVGIQEPAAMRHASQPDRFILTEFTEGEFAGLGGLVRPDQLTVPPARAPTPGPSGALPTGAPGEALAGADTVAPPGAPAGTVPAAAPGAPATQFDTAGNVVAGEAVPAGMPPEMAAGLTPAELGRVAGLDPELVARMQANAPRIVSQFEKDRTAFQNLQAQLAVVGDPPPTISAAQAALKRAEDQGALTPTVTKEADTLLRGMAPRYPNDTPLLDPAAEAPALLQSWLYERGQQIAKGSRLKDLPSWVTIPAQGWNWAMNAMRMLEVLSGMQPAKHIADAYLHRVGFAGDVGIPDMGANLWQALRTGQEAGLGPASAEWYASHGLAPQAALTKSAYAADIGTALEQAGTSTAGQSGFYRARTYLKNVTDALARTASDTARNGGFMAAFDETAAKEAPAFAEQLTGILGDAGAPVAEQVRAAQGIVTPQQLSEWMQAAGAAPAAAKEALFALGDFQRTASQAGMALADKMAPGAVTLTNLDEALRYAIPFHTFATRQAPRTLELFLTNPKIWELFDAYHRAAQEENQQAGILPGTRLSQRVPVFEIAGQKVYINPLDYFAEDRPFKQPFNSPKQSPLIGEPYQRLSQQGLGLAGPLGLLLNATGALGPAPPPELTPVDALLSNALSAVAGQQITMPWQGLGNARLSNTPIGAPPGSIGAGVDAFDPTLEVRKRLAEKSMEDTGRVNDPRYVAAMANTADPLYQAAAREVNGRELLQELVRMLGLPVGLQNRAEGAIGQGMAGLPMVNAAGGAPGQWTMPTIPYANAQGPLVTYADRERMLLDRARTNPAALGYSAAYSTGAQAEGGTPSSAYSQFADQVRKDWQSGSMAQRNAILLDPRKRGVIMADQIQHAPLFRLPGSSGGGGRAPLQDILPITP